MALQPDQAEGSAIREAEQIWATISEKASKRDVVAGGGDRQQAEDSELSSCVATGLCRAGPLGSKNEEGTEQLCVAHGATA